MNRTLLVLLSILIVGGVIGGAAYYRYHHPLVAASQPTTATAPVTQPATVAAVEKPKPHPTTQLLDILRAGNPDYPTTQRLDTSLDLKYAARILLSDPVYLDNQANLWITRHDAPAEFDFAKAAASETATHIVRDTVVFVLWEAGDKGKWLPHLVVKNPQAKGYELVDADDRRPLADPYGFDWSRALVLLAPPGEPAQIVVPTATGACAFAFSDDPKTILKNHRQLVDAKDKNAKDRAVQLVMDTQGVIAYVTNAAGTHGETGLARFAPKPAATADANREYAWSPLPGWADKILYLVPLLDGSVLQISSVDDEDEKDKVAFSLNTLAKVTIDQKRVLQLIYQLADPDSDKRDQAFKTLTTFGPGIAPIMEKVLDEQPVEAQIRIRQLLKNKITPSLGSMSLVDGRMRVVNRLPDGGIIFYAEAGVSLPRPDDAPTYVTPAWLSLRPGRAVELLPASLVADLQPGKQTIIPWSFNDYIVLDPVQGPEWYIANHLEPLLRKEHRHFNRFTGIDSTGRWIFQTSGVAKTASTTHPSTTRGSGLGTQDSALIIDPHLPDPTPRLPGWLLPASTGKVGWDKNNWPVIYMDAKPDPVPWALGETEWRVIDEKKESVLTTPPAVTPPSRPATTRVATTTTTSPATQDSSLRTEDFLLSTPDGTQYYDGRQTLTLIHPDGSRLIWPLPQKALGTGKPTLLRTRDGHLFLFNEPGRVVRIRPTPDSAEPFKVEAVFTRGIPSDPTPLRIWLDPADRICIAHDQNRITVLFPPGRIPPAIAQKMRPEDFPPDEP